MDSSKKETVKIRAMAAMKALEANNMNAYYAETAEDAKNIVKSIMKSGDVVTHGGSVTLAECGITDLLKSGEYTYLDRSAAGLSNEDIEQIYRKTFSADVYLTSTNAITENGELYNVDGNSNRVAPMLFGPQKVIVVAGYNKIVNTLDDAVKRVKEIAAPANCIRLKKDTYCAKSGECVSLKSSSPYMCSGCKSEDRICRNYVVMASQRIKGRINVIIVGQELGY